MHEKGNEGVNGSGGHAVNRALCKAKLLLSEKKTLLVSVVSDFSFWGPAFISAEVSFTTDFKSLACLLL